MTALSILPASLCSQVTPNSVLENFLKKLIIKVGRAVSAQEFNPHVPDNLCHHRALILPRLLQGAFHEVKKLKEQVEQTKSIDVHAPLSEEARILVDFYLLTLIKAPHSNPSKGEIYTINPDKFSRVHKSMNKLSTEEKRIFVSELQERVHRLSQEKFSTMEFLQVLHEQRATVGVAERGQPPFAFFRSDGVKFHRKDEENVKFYRVIVLDISNQVETIEKLTTAFDETIIKGEQGLKGFPCHVVTAYCEGGIE